MSVKDKDLGWQVILERTKALAKNPIVKTGVQGKSALDKKIGPDGKPDPTVTVVDIGTFHEFGTEHIPERSHIRSTFDENVMTYRSMIAKFKDEIFDPTSNMTPKKALNIVGLKMVADIRKKIRDGLAPAWAESTRKAKLRKSGHAIIAEVPLIDTGQYLRSIDHKVEEEG